jgi:hypothetical protein
MDFTALIKELEIDKLPKEQQAVVLNQIIGTLHTRVGVRMSTILTPEQQKHLEEVTSKKGDEAAIAELEKIYPKYRDLYQEELDKLKDDLKAIVPK